MKIKSIICFSLLFAALTINTFASPTVDSLSTQAASEDHSAAMAAIRELRTMGQVGLDALFVKYAAEIERFAKTGDATDEWKRIATAIDTVAMQKDAYASHLYWYTNLDDAKRIAKQKNKPILTLRLLGNLNEEFSCANSRLFRALLYPNAEISTYLRDNYVLHWQSVRPAPRITIDFGDGRKIERTITGNSIHYIVDDDGRIIEALPGLYSPKAFMIYLTQAKQVNDVIGGKDKRQQDIAVMRYRKLSFDRIKEKRDQAIARSKIKLAPDDPNTVDVLGAYGAAPVAVTKMVVTDEISLLRVFDNFHMYEPRVDFSEWQKLADLYSPSPVFDEASADFIRRQTARTGLTDAEFKKMLTKVRGFVGLDTTRNDFLYHTQLYSWLNRGPVNDLEAFNSRVYSELFKTPDSDKWLGLYSSDVYTALDGNGIIK